jgi:uncharacterized protein
MVFIPFIYELRERKVPVGTHEALSLAKAMSHGLHDNSLDGFYYVARALIVHDERHLDAFDEAFLHHFKGIEIKSMQLKDELLQWLQDAKEYLGDLTPEERELFEKLDLDELRKLFEDTMAEQDERHDGGSRWIGTGGKSPFGHGGAKRPGIRVGGPGKHRSAIQVADARQYRPYRSDLTIDVHQMGMALRRLRAFAREGAEEELDLEATVDETAKNVGELEIVTRPPKRPNLRVILLMDVGGSMDPYAYLVSRLFTAAKRANHFKELRCYYFHNCVYGRVYGTERFDHPITVHDLLRECDKHYKLIMVGDALMAPYELLAKGGSISYNDDNSAAGIVWLYTLQQHFNRSVWLNPEPQSYWREMTIDHIRQVFEMFPLTLDGISDAMACLNKGRERRV